LITTREAMRKLFALLICRLRQLRWKLTLSYTLVTVAALLVLEIAFIIGLAVNLAKETKVKPELVFNDLHSEYTSLVSSYLSKIPPDIEGLREHLGQYKANSTNTEPIMLGNFFLGAFTTNITYLIFLDADGTLIDTLPHGFLENAHVGKNFVVSEIPGLEEPLKLALSGETDYNKLYTFSANNRMVGAVPVIREKYRVVNQVAPILSESDQDQVLGAVAFMRKMGVNEVWTFSEIARQVGISLLFITVFAAVLGTIIGSLTASGLVWRLKKLFVSADAWSQGNFSIFVDDPSGDELGRLAQGLNHMAAQLENLLEERQQMSVIEERNRLARDLHDSVKQQAFAASAQLGAARAHFHPDPEEAEEHLVEAEKLLYEVRQELTDLIQELRPFALKGRGLATAVREYALDCSNQTGIDISVRIQNERPLPLDIEQALFRIVQGALANVARHSQADRAEVRLIYGMEYLTLTISDNGSGFDFTKQHHGLGLRSMYERAEKIHGNLLVESAPGRGTKVSIRSVYRNDKESSRTRVVA
jgi:signal transduction histidine kinase